MANQWQEIVPVMPEFDVWVTLWAGNGQLTGVAASLVGGPPPIVWPPGNDGTHKKVVGLGAEVVGKTLLINVAAAQVGGPDVVMTVRVHHIAPHAPDQPFAQTLLGPRTFPFEANGTAQIDVTLDFI